MCESPLFKSLFRGDWKDVNKQEFELPITDPYVTAEVFEAVVGTMYGRDLDLTTANAKGVFATTSLLQMSELSQQCLDFIVSHLALQNVADYLHFASSHQYLHSKNLIDSCAKYYMEYVPEMRSQFADIPLPVLQDILLSDRLAVPSEFHRFMLALEVFKSKMDASWTNLEIDRGHIDSTKYNEEWTEMEEEFHDCPQEPSTTPDGQGLTSPCIFDFRFSHKELAEIRAAFEDVLCDGIRYEHLTDVDALEVATKIDELDMPAAVRAFQQGMFKARLLRMSIQGVHSEAAGCSASSMLQKSGLSTFRFSCELADVMNVGLYGLWESDKHFYAGSDWWLKVEGKKMNENGEESACLEVRLCCASGAKDECEYTNKLTPHVFATVHCGDVSQTTDKCGAQWLSHSDFVLRASRMQRCLTHMGSIRFVVIVDLVLSVPWP